MFKKVSDKINKTIQPYMNYKETCRTLGSISKLGSRPGLNNISRLCMLLGNPQDRLMFIHVAGTNGKGSTCTMIASILNAAGYKTGLYMSPYLEDYRDSFLINSTKISKDAFARVVSYVYKQAAKMATKEELHATEFEILTAAAFVWFYQSNCDIVVLETGMGGRLDATNIIKNPLASVITPIALDHTAFLGNSVEKITWEKCGIIKQNSITICYPNQYESALDIIKRSAQEKDNLLIVPRMEKLELGNSDFKGTSFRYRGENIHVSLPGDYQAVNAITAIETVKALSKHGFLITHNMIKRGISSAFLPARQEVLSHHPFVLLDGAHNLHGIKALARLIKSQLNNKHIIMVMGMLSDKQYKQAIEIMAKLCDEFIAVPPSNSRSWNIEMAGRIANVYCKNVSVYNDVHTAIKEAVKSCPKNGAIIVFGSLYLVHKVKEATKKLKYLLN